jgi:hypothetical protein
VVVEGFGHCLAEAGVVDGLVDLMDDDAAAGEPFAECGEQSGVRFGVTEGGAVDVDGAHSPQGDEQLGRSRSRCELGRDPPTEFGHLLRRCPHQGDGGVVDEQVAVGELGRDGLHRAEVDHVERAEADHLR